jgi:sulfite exporter TauE/SafE/copper chaperone CopZ
MGINRVTMRVEGMTCGACERRIEKELKALGGVLTVVARTGGGSVTVEYETGKVDRDRIEATIESTGYPIQREKHRDTGIALGIGLALSGAYLAASSLGAFSYLPKVEGGAGFAMLFAIGALSSFHCVAMCGGIALSQSVTTGERLSSLAPGLLYNAGRVASYTSIGALAGGLGSALQLSAGTRGAITLIAALFMILLGLKMFGIIRSFPSLLAALPKPVRARVSSAAERATKSGPFAVGLLNGLLPCGPLQSMQLYALGTGSAAAGALAMLWFSLGTVPLMFLFALTATILPRKFMPRMVKASAVLVIFLGTVTLARAASIAGISLPGIADQPSIALREMSPGDLIPAQATEPKPITEPTPSKETATSTAAADKPRRQTVLTEFKNGRYVPFAVRVGIPVSWTIRISERDLNGCNDEIVIPAYGISQRLAPGDTVIEFTPAKAGKIPYSCWMGMIRSSITVTE